MRSLFSFTTLSAVLVLGLASCAPPEGTPDELAGESVAEATLDTSAKVADDAYTYFEISADLRKCAAPVCGGWFLSRLNRPLTRCHDGRLASTCYTPVLDWSQANLSEDQKGMLLDACYQGAVSEGVHAIVRGRFSPTNSTTPRPGMGRFVIDEAWVAEGDAVSSGAFVRVEDNGLRCFAAPCPNVTETTLNMARVADIAEVDWKPAGFTDVQISACINWMSGADGLLIAGDRYMVSGDGGSAKARTATAAYHRLVGTAQ